MKTTTIIHMKFLRLKRKLNLPHFQTVGVLESLWVFASANAQDGGIGRHTNEELAAALEWQGDPDKLVEDLVSTGWLDRHPECRLCIHDWEDHAPNYVKAVVSKKRKPFMVAPKNEVELPTKVDNPELPTKPPELPTQSIEPSSQVISIQAKPSQVKTVSNSNSCEGMSPEAELTHLWMNNKRHRYKDEDYPHVLEQMSEKLRLGRLTFEIIKKEILKTDRDRTEKLWDLWKRLEGTGRQENKQKTVQEAMINMAGHPIKSKNLEYAFHGNI